MAVELDKFRQKEETTIDEEKDVIEVEYLSSPEGVGSPEVTRDDSPSLEKKVAKFEHDTPKASAIQEEETGMKSEVARVSTPKLKVLFSDESTQVSQEQEKQETPLTPKTPTPRRLMVKLRPPKKPDSADVQRQQSDDARVEGKEKKRKRRLVEDSVDELKDEELPVRQNHNLGRVSKRLRREPRANYNDAVDYEEAEDE
jgi:hypothetical protein